jgi:hypothetical protein
MLFSWGRQRQLEPKLEPNYKIYIFLEFLINFFSTQEMNKATDVMILRKKL